MVDIKLSLTVTVPGAVPFSKQLCFKNSTIEDKKGRPVTIEAPIEGMTEPFTAWVPMWNKQLNKAESRRTTLHICKRRPAHQTINMSTQAYQYMIDGNYCPEWFYVPGKNASKEWKSLSQTQRLELHLARVAADLGGEIDSYFVAED